MGWDVGITAKSKNPDAAATFLNFLTTNTARAIIMKHQNPPGAPGPVIGLGKDPVLSTIVSEYSRLLQQGKLVTYIDAAYPGTSAYDFYANVQSMAAGKMTPARPAEEDAGRMGRVPRLSSSSAEPGSSGCAPRGSGSAWACRPRPTRPRARARRAVERACRARTIASPWSESHDGAQLDGSKYAPGEPRKVGLALRAPSRRALRRPSSSCR